MKKVLMILGILFIFAANSQVVFAHPPSDIKISYDTATKILKASIIHGVSNVKKHYIVKVDISLNGEEIISQKISVQDNNDVQAVEVYIPDTKAGDRLAVEGYCSISGKLEKEITIK